MKTINRRKAIKEICAWTGLLFVPKYLAHADPDAEAAILSQAPSSSSSTVISSGLQARWTFLEGSGTTTADVSGNGHTGTLNASPTWGVTGPGGVTGSGMTFNGSTQYVDCGNFADNLSAYTLSCWCKLVNFANADQPMIAKLNTGGFGNGTGWGLGGEVTNLVIYAQHVADLDAWSGWDPDGTSYLDSNWHHLLGTINNTGAQISTQLYIDNVLITFSQDQNGTLAGGQLGNAVSVRIASDANDEFFNGSLADCRVYNRQLSSTEVGQIFAKTG